MQPISRAAWTVALAALVVGYPFQESTSSDLLPASKEQGRVVQVRVANPKELAGSAYALSFTTGSQLAVGDKITVTAPIGTDFTDSDYGWRVEAAGIPVPVADVAAQPFGGDFTLNRVVITLAAPIAAGSELVITVAWVTNPGPGKHLHLTVATTKDPELGSTPYDIEGEGLVAWRTYQDPAVPPQRCWGTSTGTTNCPVRSYMVYAPLGYRGHPHALLVDLHGCIVTAATEARWSRFHEIARDRGLVVLFPQQSTMANGTRCWNWFDPAHQQRGTGEPSLIAGIVREVMRRYGIDPERVHITGLSAGGAMANIMMVTYPDLFASGVVDAGCQYGGLPCIGSASAQPTFMSAQAAVNQMGSHMRSVPLFAVTGDLDAAVPPANTEQVVQQWLAIDSLRRSGRASPVPVPPTESHRQVSPDRRAYTVDVWRDAAGCQLAQRWTVHGMAHQWSGAPSNGSVVDTVITDPKGPDLRTAIVDFFLSHPKSASCP